ncbi:MAG: ribbon-helix-helix protein, CopG family [bacterium]
MSNIVTIRLDRKLAGRLNRISRRLGRTRSDVVREALRRQLALLQFEICEDASRRSPRLKGILRTRTSFATSREGLPRYQRARQRVDRPWSLFRCAACCACGTRSSRR